MKGIRCEKKLPQEIDLSNFPAQEGQAGREKLLLYFLLTALAWPLLSDHLKQNMAYGVLFHVQNYIKDKQPLLPNIFTRHLKTSKITDITVFSVESVLNPELHFF